MLSRNLVPTQPSQRSSLLNSRHPVHMASHRARKRASPCDDDLATGIKNLECSSLKSFKGQDQTECLNERPSKKSRLELDGDQNQELCPRCQSIEFETVLRPIEESEIRLWRQLHSPGGLHIVDLGWIDDKFELRTCPLCRLFASICVQESRSGRYHLRAIDSLTAVDQSHTKSRWCESSSIPLAVVPVGRFSGRVQSWSVKQCTSGLIALAKPTPPTDSGPNH